MAITSGGPRYAGELFAYEKILEIREDPDNLESILANPFVYVCDQDGYYYIADSGNQRVAVFSAEGEYVRSFGREGDGPGEFRRLSDIRIVGGVLHVQDIFQGRTSLFRSDGLFLEAVTIPRSSSLPPPIWKSRDDRLIVIAPVNRRESMVSGIERTGATVLTVDRDTLATLRTVPVPRWHQYTARRWGTLQAPIYFAGTPLIHFYHHLGILMTTGLTPVVDIFGTDGTLTKRIRLDIPPEQVESDERRSLIAILDREVAEAQEGASEESGVLDPDMARGLRNNVQINDPKAFWIWMIADAEGYLWLQIPHYTDYWPGDAPNPRYRLISPEGEYLGVTRWPVGNARTIQDGLLLATVREEESGLSVPTVYRIRSVVRGFRYP